MNKTEKKIRMAIQNSHLGSGKLLTNLYHTMLVHGMSQKEIEEFLTQETKDGSNDKCNNEHTDGAIT